jgi:SCP-2 sterol transfer family
MRELIGRLDAAEPEAGERMRGVVGRRRAQISLDDETVDVDFDGDELRVEPPSGRVDGEGTTDRHTVLDILDGYIEVTDAILDGRLTIVGETEDVSRMFIAVEILLDGSTRIPPLQDLARDFREDPCREPRRPPKRRSSDRPWHPTGGDPSELSVLERRDLLP